MKIDLKQSSYRSEMTAAKKVRTVEWKIKAVSLDVSPLECSGPGCAHEPDCYFVDIECNKRHCYKFSRNDFVGTLYAMLASLPVSQLIAINAFIATLLTEKTNKESKTQVGR